MKPPADWFNNPNLTKLTPLTITKEGRIYGHLADWDGCHTGFSSICVPPFRSSSNYAYFNIAPVETADGELIKTGKLMFSRDGVGHAPTEQWTTAEDASKHYDDATKDAGLCDGGGGQVRHLAGRVACSGVVGGGCAVHQVASAVGGLASVTEVGRFGVDRRVLCVGAWFPDRPVSGGFGVMVG